MNRRRRVISSTSCVGCAACAWLRRALDVGKSNIQHVENPRRGSHVLVTTGNSDVPGSTGIASTQQGLHRFAEFESKLGRLSIATSSNRRADPASPSATAVDEPHKRHYYDAHDSVDIVANAKLADIFFQY